MYWLDVYWEYAHTYLLDTLSPKFRTIINDSYFVSYTIRAGAHWHRIHCTRSFSKQMRSVIISWITVLLNFCYHSCCFVYYIVCQRGNFNEETQLVLVINSKEMTLLITCLYPTADSVFCLKTLASPHFRLIVFRAVSNRLVSLPRSTSFRILRDYIRNIYKNSFRAANHFCHKIRRSTSCAHNRLDAISVKYFYYLKTLIFTKSAVVTRKSRKS